MASETKKGLLAVVVVNHGMEVIVGTVEGGGIHHRLEVGPGEINFRSLQVLACCLSDARDYDFPHRPVTPVSNLYRPRPPRLQLTPRLLVV